MTSFVRISALLWADILVAYAFFVMQNYLTDVWKLSFAHAAGIVNIWGGISKVLPVFFLFLVDVLLGNFKMLVISSIAYSVGIGFVTMSTPPVLADSIGTCNKYQPKCISHTQKVLFFTGMALIAVGVAGNLVSVFPFLEEQKGKSDDNSARNTNNNEGVRDFLRIPGFILVVVVPVVGAIALPYIKPWSLRFGIPAICTVAAMLLFLSGSCTYRKAEPLGSPITNVCRVFVAAASKILIPTPLDAEQLYQGDENERQSFTRTRFLKCLEKAAIILPESKKNQRRGLCSVAQVEEAKIVVRMVPMWITFVICGIVSSIGNTYFVEQAKNMNRNIGKWKVPAQIFLLVQRSTKDWFVTKADHLLKVIPSKSAPAFGIAVAMMFSVLCCVAAAIVEIMRLKVSTSHGSFDKDIPMSAYWLLFQFVLLAGIDSFLETSVAAFYNDQSPPSMRNYIDHFTKGVSGLGYMCSVLSVYVVGKISEIGGKRNWFQHNLRESRLDRYYWVLAVLSSVNLVVFIAIASCYRYKNREEPGQGAIRGSQVYSEENVCCSCFG